MRLLCLHRVLLTFLFFWIWLHVLYKSFSKRPKTFTPSLIFVFLFDAAVSELVFVAIHTKPDDAVSEVDKLVDVYDDVIKRWKIKNIVIMGDFNAACNYVRDTEWKNIRLANDKRFWWLIDDCQDTTLKGSRCAYDRYYHTRLYKLPQWKVQDVFMISITMLYYTTVKGLRSAHDMYITMLYYHMQWKVQDVYIIML